ncbi:hypothetical protein Tco_0377118 [Tanacetum coccineum]
MDDEFLVTAYPKVHENLKLITDERVIEENPESHSGSSLPRQNLDDTYNFGDQFLYDKLTEDDQEKSKVIEESDSTIPDPSHQTVTSTPPVIAPFTNVSSTKPSSLVTPPPINTEATTIITSLPEITPFISPLAKSGKIGAKEIDKIDDEPLLKILERHTADLIEKYSALPGPESIKNQESEKSPKEIIRIKREQGKEKQDSTYSFKHKVALEEFDLKSALFKHMNKNKTANRNPANYHLYHALGKALIADEDAIDKEVAVKVKDHKRKHDSDDEEDDDDDEGPSAGSNQGRSVKRRRPESAASGSAQPPSKNDHQSSKKPRESDASASIQHPALTSTGWQITDTRDDVVNSLMHMLPNNIQITDTSLMHMLNLNPSPHKRETVCIQTLTPAEQEAADIMKALKESKKMSKRQPGTGGSNEGTAQGFLGLRKKANTIVGSNMDSEQFDRDVKSGDDNKETKPEPEEIYNPRSHNDKRVPVENVSFRPRSSRTKGFRYDNSDASPLKTKSCFLQQRKIDSSQQGLEFLFSPLLEEYYNPTHGQAEETIDNQATECNPSRRLKLSILLRVQHGYKNLSKGSGFGLNSISDADHEKRML